MATLDDNREYIDPADVSIWPTVQKYGGIMALASIAFTLVTYLVGMDNTTMSFVLSGISLVVTILILRAAVKHFRDVELGGHISLGKVIALGVPIIMI
ncbi:MAG: DUF4199 family protein, partial [Bacteroidota bacterium]